MIQEANRNARIAAEKFAGDSGSRVGRIRHAVQGPFEVEDVDESSPDRKKRARGDDRGSVSRIATSFREAQLLYPRSATKSSTS